MLTNSGGKSTFPTLPLSALADFSFSLASKNDRAFASCFYLRGYSGWALRLAKFAIAFGGISKEVKAFCHAPTLAEQSAIWESKLRPVLLSKWITKLFLANPAFLWNALGVPSNQAQVFLSETTTEQFAIDTLDPVAYGTHVKTGAYHYQVCLEQKYTRESW
jgi:betaine lipid synthase